MSVLAALFVRGEARREKHYSKDVDPSFPHYKAAPESL